MTRNELLRRVPVRLAYLIGLVFLLILAYQFDSPLRIDVGARSANPFVEGFSFREVAGSIGYRWSGPQARLYLRGIGNQEGTLHIQAGAAAGPVTLRLNGQEVGFSTYPGELGTQYTVPVSRALVGLGGDLVVTLESETFTAPPDTRELGVQLVSASFERGSGPVIPAPRTALYIVLAVVLAYSIGRAWTGSSKAGWGIGALVAMMAAWGIAQARMETVYLARTLCWLGVAIYGGGWAVVWLLRRFYPVEDRILRVLGLFVLAAFLLRLPLAMTPGYITDVQDYVVWSYKVARFGIGSAYDVVEGLWLADYPPVLLYLFWGLGELYQELFAPDFLYPVVAGDPALRAVTTNAALLADPIHRTLLRLPAMVADLVTGALIFAFARRSNPVRISFLLAAAYWFNPVTIYNSAVWGQTDAVHTLLVVLALALVETKRSGWGFFALGLGALTKPQALVFGPLLLVCAFQRQRWRGVLLAGAGGALGLALAAAPMVAAGALQGLLAHLGSTVGHHPVVSANAHNLWWFVLRGKIGMESTAALVGGISYRTMGMLLLAAAYGLALGAVLRRSDRPMWPLAAYVGFASFVLPTEIHENYGFAVLALLAVAMLTDRRYSWLYLALTMTMVANYALQDPNLYELLNLHSPEAQLAAARWLNALANTLIFGGWTALEVVNLRRTPGRGLGPGREAAATSGRGVCL